MAGRLLVVGTPIGNLGDLTPRAADALTTADLVVAEDTRVTGRLLSVLGVRRPMTALNDHNAETQLPRLLSRLGAGETLALTSDAGMPGVSDPGAQLVAAARAAGHEVQVLPGPSAVTAAMALAGVEASGFVFGGFLPARPVTRRLARLDGLLTAAAAVGLPLVLFEAPTRVRSTLVAVAERVPEARVAVARELTKVHEEVVVGTATEVADARPTPRGEFTIVISALPAPVQAAVDTDAIIGAARGIGLPDRAVVELLRAAGLGRREAYRAVQESATEA